MENLYFAKVNEKAIIPSKEDYNAGFDIYACFEEDYFIIEAGETRLVPTGIASAIPTNYYIQIQERGSTGSKGIKYSGGVIDSSYRGEWFLATTNCNNKPVIISKIDINKLEPKIRELIENAYIIYPYEKALFQGIIHCIHNEIKPKVISYEELKDIPSERMFGSLGSSGK